ncbi:hypothetical protein A374_06261 [Fictibacillus macauensis ZFHKF-1]|uniref:THIF-type NAD/FAD binding fold domain-containing protein n=1 Tax=Fictibacillus macauensis ZFHKF-1 TaxID=1196324 RepID=I8UH01_9BACL|nr:ThiF family adenylyltransferase [Fictibacillus macauensis]EIT86180.1 hypothetical protein A374_06261 [Fictibacillus macauensis ZFHKF-1]
MYSRPKFNPLYPFHHLLSGHLRLGVTADKVYDIEDPTGSIYRLITLLDGSHNAKTIFHLLNQDFPCITLEEVNEAILSLKDLGFLLHTDPSQHSLSIKEKERFKGNINYFSHFTAPNEDPCKYQDILSKKRITIIGMGAFGCSILFNLAGLGIKNVKIIDFDTVSLSNFNRQMLFKENDIGRFKIDVAKEFMDKYYSDMIIETCNMEIDSLHTADSCIENTDLVVLAADQPYLLLPRWINEVCVNKNIPFISGGINIHLGQFQTIIPNITGCIDCMYTKNIREIENYYTIIKNFLELNFIPSNMATSPNIMIITGIICSEIFKLLSDIQAPESSGKLLMIDFMNFELTELTKWDKEVSCPTCGDKPQNETLFELFDQYYDFNKGVVKR